MAKIEIQLRDNEIQNVVGGSSTFTFGSGEVTPGTDRIFKTSHGLVNGDVIWISSNSDTDIPDGLLNGVTYFIVGATANDFQLSLTLGGAVVDIINGGGGTNTVNKSAKVNLPSTAINNVKTIKVRKSDLTNGRVVLVADGSDTIGDSNYFNLFWQNDNVELQSDGISNWVVVNKYNNIVSHVEHYNGLGHGSTGIRVRTFTNHDSFGPALKSSADTTNGDAIVVYQSGFYSISYSDTRVGGNHFVGISKNADSTVTLTLLTFDEVLAVNEAGTTITAHCSTTIRLEAGDIIKAHDTGSNDGTDVFSQMRISQISVD